MRSAFSVNSVTEENPRHEGDIVMNAAQLDR